MLTLLLITGLSAGTLYGDCLCGDYFKSLCMHHFDKNFNTTITSGNGRFDPTQVKEPCVIFVNTDFLREFFTLYHPRIKSHYVLITHNSDYDSPGAYANFLDDNKIIHWFGQNPSVIHKKFTALPIGLPNKYFRNENYIDGLVKQCHTSKKKHVLYANFSVKTYKKRQSVLNLFIQKKFLFSSVEKPFVEYFCDLSESYFVLSPRGTGLDCHRTWEALMVGSVPVVQSSYMDQLLVDLPVLIIQDWNKITYQFLQDELQKIQTKKNNMAKLSHDYWKTLIELEVTAVQ